MAATAEKKDVQESPAPQRNVRSKGTRRCRVYRQGENKNAPITVTPNDIKRKKEFWPGQVVELTDQHIEILRNACVDSEIPLPENSGVYQSENPRFEAQKQNPGYEVHTDLNTGTLYLKRNEPLYIVEILDL